MRNNIIEGFSRGKVDILVATRLITRGIDLDVNTVINYDLPLEVTEYIHRVGRCGRNGARGVTYTFLDFNNRADYLPSVIRAIALVSFLSDSILKSLFSKSTIWSSKTITESLFPSSLPGGWMDLSQMS